MMLNNLTNNGLLLLLSYLIGSFPTSYIAGKLFKGIDIRNFGSGNVGATNAVRVLGTKIGIPVLLIDILKGFLLIFLVKHYLQPSHLFLIGLGISAILGHIFTIFLKFKGGKGVATSAGVFFALTPLALTIALICFILVVMKTKYVSLGSILAAITLFLTELIINFQSNFSNKYELILTGLIALTIIYTHRANIKRLRNGEENKISFKK